MQDDIEREGGEDATGDPRLGAQEQLAAAFLLQSAVRSGETRGE